MSSALVANGQLSQAELEFQERMKERMRQAFGDLMPDSVLAGIVAKGIDDAFFKSRTIEDVSSWNRKTIPAEPWLVEFVKKEAEKQTQVAVEKWVAENQDKIGEILKGVLSSGLASAVVKAFDYSLSSQFIALQNELNEKFRQMGNR